jgi:hypothetical protein
MRAQTTQPRARGRPWSPEVMREELSHAVFEALYELDVLPEDADGAVLGLYAILDDLSAAIRRAEGMDTRRTA